MSPVHKKLHIKPGARWLFYGAPQNYLTVLEPLPGDITIAFEPAGDFDGIQLFATNLADLSKGLKTVIPLLKNDTLLWITYPKKSSGMQSGLEMMGSWDEPAGYGLRVVTAVSINETWTALRFKREGQSKVSDTRNAEIKTNGYSSFIDVDNKLITLPPDLKGKLMNSPGAMAFYETLSYSNKKEYVVWVISAKQEKTRAERLSKTVEKLLAGKKNPAKK